VGEFSYGCIPLRLTDASPNKRERKKNKTILNNKKKGVTYYHSVGLDIGYR
jgi:hypothetical protein